MAYIAYPVAIGIHLVLQALWFILPAYFANSSPVLGHKLFGKYNYSIDFGKKLKDGKRVFGEGKTWNGLLFGVAIAMVVACVQSMVQANYPMNGFLPMSLELGFLLGAGALFGDLVKSFFKRRKGFERGKSWFPFDQIDFILGAFLFSLILVPFNWKYFIILLIVTPAIHWLTNYIGFKLKFKKEPY